MESFKLRCSLFGHSKDVRAVHPASVPDGGILSASRDVTARVWIPNEFDHGFTEGTVMSGHSGFVSAICMLSPTDEHPHGLVVTGSNDSNIHVYTVDEPLPLYKLQGHSDAVCSLAAGKFGTLLSGSWDKTAKVWLSRKCVMTLEGHMLAVWCVALAPEQGYMVTGSADRTIKIWRAGRCEATLKGHEDCVRGLAVMNAQEFLSCSNDASIRRWNFSGHVLQVYFSHTNFVYGVASMPGSANDFVSVSEDRTLKVWQNGECKQTVSHPCTSVWCVCVLSNGDIVTGSSDGVVRVFTRVPERMAAPEDLAAYSAQVAAAQIPTQVGDINADKLPGPEQLLKPGKKDGAVVMIKRDVNVEAHQWNAAEQQWVKVGDVIGSTGAASSKTLFEGKEYDFVFSVDIEEGKPPLKLPYNMTEDPFYAAQRFISKHGLSQLFLDQVAEFITQNSQSVSMSQLPATGYSDPLTGGARYVPGSEARINDSAASGSDLADPFTGTGRYVPSDNHFTASANSKSQVPTGGADPFTGGSSYRVAIAPGEAPSNPFFPLKETVTFNLVKPEAIIRKLKEFNKQLPGGLRCEEGDLDVLNILMDVDKTPTAPMLNYLWRILQWPRDFVFPAIDVLRVALRNATVNEFFCNTKEGPAFMMHLVAFLDSTTENQLLSLRALANMASHTSGINLLLQNRESLTSLIVQVASLNNKNIQSAMATILMNYAVLLKLSDDVEAKSQILSAIATIGDGLTDSEAQFRLCVALGTLIWRDDNSRAMAQSLQVRDLVVQWKSHRDLAKLTECASALETLL